jgi:serine/threonine-protein kinase
MSNFPIPPEDDLQKALGLAQKPAFHRYGGFKAVYLADDGSGNSEALKAIYIPRANSEEEKLLRNQLIARAKREITALRECRSPNIVKLGVHPTKMISLAHADYLTYSEEFLSGESLVSQLKPEANPASLEYLTELFISMIKVVKDLYSIGYLHRDIKPDNIMDTGNPSRRFVLLDMGIAYKMHGTDITQGPNPPGTLRYMAPELLGPSYKDSMDFRSEIYSSGLTVYVVATKSHPFAPQPEHPYATMYRIMNTSPTPLHTLRPDLPLSFCRIVDRCIKKRSALRYNNLDLLESEIRKA